MSHCGRLLLTMLLLSIPRETYSNPIIPVRVSEYSTHEDWIELFVVAFDGLGGYFFVINETDTTYVDPEKATITEDSLVLLDQTNTSGFDLPEDYGIIDLYGLNGGKYEYGSYDWHPAPPEGSYACIVDVYQGESKQYPMGLTTFPTPGEPNVFDVPAQSQAILINEIASDTDVPFLEICNISDTPVDISGWTIILNAEIKIDDNTIIPANGVSVINIEDPYDFVWKILDNDAFLLNAERYVVDMVMWAEDNEGISYSRYPDGNITNNPNVLIESIPTPGAPNRLKETAVVEKPPIAITLHQNTPNPFNPRTAIPVSIDRSGHVTLTVYSVTGQAIRTLYDGTLTAGYHSFIWDGRDSTGNDAASGVYVYRLDAGLYKQSRTMALVR